MRRRCVGENSRPYNESRPDRMWSGAAHMHWPFEYEQGSEDPSAGWR
ncbi:hypothetical protein GLE_3690 [Lysobacter enzymogenes]|uniref:Uncharacterized protein n=1 Tax=Lysobacter enzymogenes TaxID=69 RepID=A0A0S2DKE9_LYSEN|nr:hypothetical protein GLE_3690 [Lysobacter enzymogenes]